MSKLSRDSSVIPIELEKFDMKKVGSDKIIVFIGKRNVGKSVLVLDYLYHNQDYPIATVISPTDNYNLTYKPHIPDDEYRVSLSFNYILQKCSYKYLKI